jgi:phospholipase D1/2
MQVYGYRMSLWAEHLGELEDTFCEPQSVKCVKRVNKIAKHNWEAYVSEEEKEIKLMKGNLMLYPVQVSRDGKVSSLRDYESFPDVGGKILGSPTTLPDVLTT